MKPLKDWTLGEIKAECKRCDGKCIDAVCPMVKWINKDEMVCAVVTGMKCTYPSEWDLSESHKWTQEEIDLAKTLKNVTKGELYLWRTQTGQIYWAYEPEGWEHPLPAECFPTLLRNQKTSLDEIIGGGE